MQVIPHTHTQLWKLQKKFVDSCILDPFISSFSQLSLAVFYSKSSVYWQKFIWNYIHPFYNWREKVCLLEPDVLYRIYFFSCFVFTYLFLKSSKKYILSFDLYIEIYVSLWTSLGHEFRFLEIYEHKYVFFSEHFRLTNRTRSSVRLTGLKESSNDRRDCLALC